MSVIQTIPSTTSVKCLTITFHSLITDSCHELTKLLKVGTRNCNLSRLTKSTDVFLGVYLQYILGYLSDEFSYVTLTYGNQEHSMFHVPQCKLFGISSIGATYRLACCEIVGGMLLVSYVF